MTTRHSGRVSARGVVAAVWFTTSIALLLHSLIWILGVQWGAEAAVVVAGVWALSLVGLIRY